MKKAALGVIALAMSFMATTAKAAEGDIRSIFPCDISGNPVDPGTMETAHKAGETVYFCVRLENSDSAMCYNYNAANPWALKYDGLYDLSTAMVLTPPAVGVYVSGRLTAAKVVLPLVTPEKKPWYTDIICSYTVRPGDMAFPMTLALANGKEVGTETDAEYLFDTVPMSYSWGLVSYEYDGYADGKWGNVIATNDCVFAFGDSPVFNTGAYSAEINSWVNDPDLRKAGLYVKTVEFAAEETTVPEGRTERVLVNIEGGVNTNGIGVVYAMVRDDAPVSLAESGVSTIEFPDPSNAEMAGTYQIAAVTIPSGEDVSSFSFRISGETKSDTPATVYLASTKGFVLDGGGVNMITNFITTTVRCVEPPPPYISVTLDDEASKTVTSGTNYTEYAAKLTVTLSEAYTEDMTVEVTPSMISGTGTDPLGRYIGMSTYSENGFSESTRTVTFTAAEMAGGTLSKDLYVYVLGGDDDTDGIGRGIKFAPAATGTAASYFDNENVTAILYIKKSTPQILYPTESYSYSGLAGGVSSTFSIRITDDYNNMKSPFTVEWLKTGSGTPQTFTVTPNSDGEAVVSVRYNAGEYTTRFRVKNASGVYSEYRTVSVQVNPAKQVSAVIEEPDDSDEYNETDEELTVRFKLTEAYDDSTLYAFLVPMDAASSNLVECGAFETGIAIRSGDTESATTAKMMLLDGSEDTLPLTYAIVLRTARSWLSGETIGTYESKGLEIYINNVAPTITEISMSGSAPVTENGGTFGGKASMGLNKVFTLTANDVEADLTNDVTSVWTFSDPNGYATTYTVKGPLDDIVLTNAFAVAGTYNCTVKLQDKDMSSREYGETFSFKVVVLNQPSVRITPYGSTNEVTDISFNEGDVNINQAKFDVLLSAPASKPLVVELSCIRTGDSGVMELASKTIEFAAGITRKTVTISDLDGTPDSRSGAGGFNVTATVVTDTLNEDMTPWKDVYLPATLKFYVVNEDPVIELPIDNGTNAIEVAVNTDVRIKWRIGDIRADLTNALSVTFTSEGVTTEFTGDNVYEGVFTNVFKSGGTKTVQMQVEDKDGGTARLLIYYEVTPAKNVYVHPYGPVPGGPSAVSKYQELRGMGRVWGDGEGRFVQNFIHTYTYDVSLQSAKIFAYGYKSGQVDDGTLGPQDIAIDSNGFSFNVGVTPSNCYSYSDPLDSFFYAWIIEAVESGEEGGSDGPKVEISPEDPVSGYGYIPLPLLASSAGEGKELQYPDQYVYALFSKEYLAQDNMGDMNQDGIPDVYARKMWSKMASDGSGETNGDGSQEGGSSGNDTEVDDLVSLFAYNGDGDAFPQAFNSPNPLKPQITNWGPGNPFIARYEIRGIHEGLNEPGISEYNLSRAETFSLFAAYVAADPANVLSGTFDENYVVATNWAARSGWTCEVRLDPTSPDTDGDVFDDGWEYYFWYFSKVGLEVDGVWCRLEGRRFDFSAPGMSTRITPDEIAEAFNPGVFRETQSAFGMDFDNDGLTDLEEYALGTNPCDWDSDGDGMSDLWEVVNGLDPCSANGTANPDCDFMARCEYAEDTFTLYTFADGRVFALPTATASSVVPAEPATTSSWYKVEVGADAYWVAEKPVTYTLDGTEYLATSVVSFASLDIGGVIYIGADRVLASGTPVTVAGEAEAVPEALLPETGFSWTDPKTLDAGSTSKALEVFNYGADGITFVPCTSNVTSYADVPADVPVEMIQEEMKITLIHDQVRTQYGFDPRVAWNINEYGFLDNRWRTPDSEAAGAMGDAGKPTNTVAYASIDEYLLMQYRAKAKPAEYAGLASLTTLAANDCLTYSTYPNVPASFVTEESGGSQGSGSGTNTTAEAYAPVYSVDADLHGADTDSDGVPDGWELYVNYNPNDANDSTSYKDGDRLSLAQEYAGVDSCNAYKARLDAAGNEICPEVFTITKNHPGRTDGWWNKFFPTDPDTDDTDGDGLKDHEERDSRSGKFPVGRNSYSASFTFIYGDNSEAYDADTTTICFRGGGLNPCSVDTDCDLLPDAWEYEFAGIVIENGEPTVSLDVADLYKVTCADEHQSGLGGNMNAHIRGGMDGTFKGDANYDFDHDGLLNFQEYLVQSLRHLRYDDSLTPIMGVSPDSRKFVRFLPFSAWDGNAFHKKCIESGFTGLGSWQFRTLGYFALPPHAWDPIACNKTGLANCANYAHSEGKGYRIMLRPIIELPLIGPVQAGGYASTDPRLWDTDNDGMDDYYEIFHGLNPLLGSAANPDERNEQGFYNFQTYDVIGSKFGGTITAWRNVWTSYGSEQPALDAIKYPWMIGTMECDADGDGLRNDEESLKVDLAKPQNTHTDPTPLWMTDSTSARFASFTSQYYGPDPYLSETPTYSELTSQPDIFCYPWTQLAWNTVVYAPGSGGINRNWMFSFEENEGFDTDHDFKRDATELQASAEPTSDPLNFNDPNRRQALYLPGTESAAVSYDSESRRSVGNEPDLLKQFTVECWVRPDEIRNNSVIIERVCVYGASTLVNNGQYIRANFRVGFDTEGRLYGEYEGSTVDSGAVRVTGQRINAQEWTHVAFTYNGSTAALYVNGEVAPVASVSGAGLIPANGIDGILQESDTSVIPYTGYRALPCANIIGARAESQNAVSVNPETKWSDFSSFYKGWIDEVRVWDGARTPTQIHASYLSRFTIDDVLALRETVYKAWKSGATRADPDPKTALPVELVLHYNFASLPGGVEARNVLTVPTGFYSAVLDNVRKPNGSDLEEALNIGWWDALKAIKSEVYNDYTIVPWIANTVAHLPVMGGSSVDSMYWSSKAAGMVVNPDGYEYPNTANPYPSYVYRFDKLNRLNRLAMMTYTTDQATYNAASDAFNRYGFQLRSEFVGTSDLVPLGGAFAKRGTDFWDGMGAMDGWTTTSQKGEIADSDGDGIPDWAENYSYVDENGQTVYPYKDNVKAYLEALAGGLLPDGSVNPSYKDIADSNHDGLYDWWQRLYDLKGLAQSDTDKDGLADFVEYLVSHVFKFGEISPVLVKSNGTEIDYFRKAGRLYLGELFADHDFMEDEWENRFPDSIVDSAMYDPHADPDGDGWSNYAECRAGTLPDRTATITAEGEQIPDYPEPMISVKAYYKDAQYVSAPIIVQAYTDGNLAMVDATWNIPGSTEPINYERVVGINPGTEATYRLGPSVVVPGSLFVYARDPAEYSVTSGSGTWMGPTSSEWREVLREEPISGNNDKSYISADTAVGEIEYATGLTTIDFAALPKYRYETTEDVGDEDGVGDTDDDGVLEEGSYSFYPPQTNTYIRTNLEQSYIKICWQSKRITEESKWEFGLSRANSGRVKEGLNTFVAFVDLDGNGVYTEGEPMGVKRDVNVGWSGTEFEIELTDHAVLCKTPAKGEGAATNTASKLYVYRYSIDDVVVPPSSLDYGPVLITDIRNRGYLFEGDFLGNGNFDVDWNEFQDKVIDNATVRLAGLPVEKVTYRAYMQEVDIDLETQSTNPVPYVEFSRQFTETQVKATPVNTHAVNYGACPKFAWTIDDDAADSFTAFTVEVLDADSKVLWNSGYQKMPPRQVSGSYEWYAPLYVNDPLANGKVFENTTTYKWRISLHNSRYQGYAWSDTQTFRMNVYGSDEVNSTGYGAITAKVKYFGPCTGDVVCVEAHTSPDFTGRPASRTFVRGFSETAEVTIAGLEAGSYYLRAFIDSDGDAKRSKWESWGYVCPRGDIVSGAIFRPVAIEVGMGLSPVETVYIEDADVDQDCLPDSYEYDVAADKDGDFLLEMGVPENDHNGYITVNPNLQAAIDNLINAGQNIGLLSMGGGQIPMQLAALALGVSSIENEIDGTTLAIKSIALENGNVKLTLGAAAEETDMNNNVFVNNGKVVATIVVHYADTLDGEWNATEVTKTFEIKEGAVSDTFEFSLEELGLDASKGFFKVELK